MKVKTIVFLEPPYKGISINCNLSYTDSFSKRMIRVCTLQGLSDRPSETYVSFSDNNGETWGSERKIATYVVNKDMVTRYSFMPWLDKENNILFLFSTEITMYHDEVLSGLARRKTFYQISKDRGYTFTKKKQIIEEGNEFDEVHYMKNVWYGRNSASIGNIPLKISRNEILIPMYYFPLSDDGGLYNPIGAYTYTNVIFLHGFWKNGYTKLEFQSSEPLTIDPFLSTRGLSEPATEMLSNGELITIMRGSNDKRKDLPGYKWVSVSDDSGWTWSKPKPFTYDDGEKIFSPASFSVLYKHSSGRIFWIGNISKKNPIGNWPRFPLVIGELDEEKYSLKRNTITIIDTKKEYEKDSLQLSNFSVYEDRETKEIIVTLSRLFANDPKDWTAPCMMYRIKIE